MTGDERGRRVPWLRHKPDRVVHSRDEWESGYSIEWVTYNEEIADWGIRRPIEYRLALLWTDDDPRYHREIASVKVPVSIAHAYGRLKRRLNCD